MLDVKIVYAFVRNSVCLQLEILLQLPNFVADKMYQKSGCKLSTHNSNVRRPCAIRFGAPFNADTNGSINHGKYGSNDDNRTGIVKHNSTNKSFIFCRCIPYYYPLFPYVQPDNPIFINADGTFVKHFSFSPVLQNASAILINKRHDII
ncbi:hypothetical protein DERP_005492 [Dermatophagoides pteronyssinus]|uniref:Uncharacterized protein n=1 Tax=Dermatophagoides pteronyssinus TaxID=6956 RepID=A0ABQ8JMR2_DERPT|nr:hypothetical protein DERP_005492 [Dermatophagoides pteronyssinus]